MVDAWAAVAAACVRGEREGVVARSDAARRAANRGCAPDPTFCALRAREKGVRRVRMLLDAIAREISFPVGERATSCPRG